MYISPMNNIQFKGTTKFLSCASNGQYKKVAENPFGTASFGDTRGLTDFVKKYSYPYAFVEETVGKVHDNATYRVYVAEPKEIVTDKIKQNHDYIVYDLEPSFPDIRSSYFSSDKEALKKEFKVVQDYLKRLEAVGDKRNLEYLSHQQQMLDSCLHIYEEGEGLLNKKHQLESKINTTARLMLNAKDNLVKYQAELQKLQKKLEFNEFDLQRKQRRLSGYQNKQFKLFSKESCQTEEVKLNQTNIDRYIKIIDLIKERIKIQKARMEYLENYISTTPSQIEFYEAELRRLKQSLLATIKEAMPSFNKLCDFYLQNGIKIAKRV